MNFMNVPVEREGKKLKVMKDENYERFQRNKTRLIGSLLNQIFHTGIKLEKRRSNNNNIVPKKKIFSSNNSHQKARKNSCNGQERKYELWYSRIYFFLRHKKRKQIHKFILHSEYLALGRVKIINTFINRIYIFSNYRTACSQECIPEVCLAQLRDRSRKKEVFFQTNQDIPQIYFLKLSSNSLFDKNESIIFYSLIELIVRNVIVLYQLLGKTMYRYLFLLTSSTSN